MTLTADRESRLLGVPEWRARPFDDFEVRKTRGHEYLVRGHAALYERWYPVAGGPDSGGWNERAHMDSFDKTHANNPDVHFLVNHAGTSLARTKSGTLQLQLDKPTGLLAEARIDRRTQDGHDLEIRMERGDLDEMSFAFRTVRQGWNADYTERTLLEVNIDKGDVSVVNNGANDQTRIRLADTKDMLEALSAASLCEMRGVDDPAGYLREVRTHIDRLIREADPRAPRRFSVGEALKVIEGRA